jgi:hypothetical protein
MAKITIEIDTHDCNEHDAAILASVGCFDAVLPNGGAGEPEPAKAADPQPEAPKATRGRPKKTTEPTPASGTPAQTDAGGLSDLEAELMGDTPVEITGPQVAAAMQAHIAKHGADKTMAVLQAAGDGAKSFKQIDAALYGAVHAALQAELP